MHKEIMLNGASPMKFHNVPMSGIKNINKNPAVIFVNISCRIKTKRYEKLKDQRLLIIPGILCV